MEAVHSHIQHTRFDELQFDVTGIPVSRIVQKAGIKIASPWVRGAIHQDGIAHFGPRSAQLLDCYGNRHLDDVANSVQEMSEGLSDMDLPGILAPTVTELIEFASQHPRECERSMIFCPRSYVRWSKPIIGKSKEQRHYPYLSFVAGRVFVGMWDSKTLIPVNARILVIEQ